jgi:hypothetical protein
MTTDDLARALRSEGGVPEGVDPGQWEDARRVLSGEGAPGALSSPLALAVLEAAVWARSAAVAQGLAASSNREVAKAARRALYRLRSAGVVVAEKEPSPRRPGPAAPGVAESLPAFVTLPDGAGHRGLLVGQPVRGGVELVEVELSDELGLLGLTRAEMSRGGWRKFVRSPEVEQLWTLTFEEARSLLAEAVRCNLATRTPFPPESDLVLRHLGVEAAQEGPPPLPAPEEGDAALAVESGDLHSEPEIASWLPPEMELKRLALRLDELRTSPLALTPEQQTVALRERVRAQAEEFFDEGRLRLYGRRLWWVAPALEKRGATHAAEVARATARRMFHRAPGLFAPFAEQLFAKVLALLARPGGQKVDGGRQEAASGGAPAAPPGERRSPGGLILP